MKVDFLGNSVVVWGSALTVCAVSCLALLFLRNLSVKMLKAKATPAGSWWDELLSEVAGGTRSYFLVSVGVYLGSFLLTLTPEAHLIIYRAFILVCLLQAGAWGSHAIGYWIENYLEKKALNDAETATSIGLVSFAVKFAMFTVLALLAFHNLGISITTLIAGLGVGGVAVALAVQSILGDLFASLSIVLDKPFVIGDFIVIEDYSGAIEHIGLKTTRICSLSGEQLIFSNGDLLKSRVRNFKRMTERRVTFVLSFGFQTSPEKIEIVPNIIKESVQGVGKTRFERAHFLTFGKSTVDVETVYWVLDADYNIYADIAQKINLEILKKLNANQIELAYPTQTFVMKNNSVLEAPVLA